MSEDTGQGKCRGAGQGIGLSRSRHGITVGVAPRVTAGNGARDRKRVTSWTKT